MLADTLNLRRRHAELPFVASACHEDFAIIRKEHRVVILRANLHNVSLLGNQMFDEGRLVCARDGVAEAESSVRAGSPREDMPRFCDSKSEAVCADNIDDLVVERSARHVLALRRQQILDEGGLPHFALRFHFW